VMDGFGLAFSPASRGRTRSLVRLCNRSRSQPPKEMPDSH
jgi:hypothetical protein